MKIPYLKILLSLLVTAIIIISCVENHVMPVFNYGSIYVTSDPSGAQIIFNDENTGKVTPDSIIDISAGEYTIMLKLNAFKDTTFSVTVNQNSQTTEDIYLIETNPKAKIVITSNPSGAQIYLNDENTGKITPATFDNLERGNYTIKLKLALYDDAIEQIVVNKDQTVNKNISMAIAGSSGTLNVTSEPSGALISLNGENTGKLTPFTFKPLQPGDYSIGLSLLNYRDTLVTTTLNSGGNVTENVKLTLYEPRGSIALSSNPSGAQIFLDGVNTQLTTPSKIRKLEAGEYDITLKFLGYVDSTFSVKVLADLNTDVPTVNMILIPLVGDLELFSDPQGASIFLNGVDTDKKTPFKFENLLAGQYAVTLKLTDFADTTFNVEIFDAELTSPDLVVLSDIVPDVEVTINYAVNTNGQLIFSFTFNQAIRFEKLQIQNDSVPVPDQNYNNQYVPAGRTIDWVYPQKISGDWKFTFTGNKAGGRGAPFIVVKDVNVQ
ncbi:MAG: PEGA domain-containing protein [Ignavibacteriales bacterium]|nr:PEGA domain-containing protein [Ignavibacteriales bacterium]